MKQFAIAAIIAGLLSVIAAAPAAAGRLEEVKQRGVLRCGVLANSAGQSMLNDRGEWKGFGIDYCRAVAAAIFDDPNKVEFRPAALGQQFSALKSGELDILEATVTYTMTREVDLGFSFVGPTIFSGLTFMAPRSLNIRSLKDLNGATICLQAGSLVEESLPNLFKANGITFKPLSVATPQQVYSMYDRGRCDVVTGDKSTLAARRLERPHPDDHVILNRTFGKSDTGPLVRSGDTAWLNVAKYTFYALVTAEELGVTRANVEQMKKSSAGDIRTFLGLDGHDGTKMGLRDDWTVSVIRSVGNYGEIWDRNLGKESPLQLPRDENKLRRDGGLLFSPSWK
jgi:general L-amino acid transport system substrate-binding protein